MDKLSNEKWHYPKWPNMVSLKMSYSISAFALKPTKSKNNENACFVYYLTRFW